MIEQEHSPEIENHVRPFRDIIQLLPETERPTAHQVQEDINKIPFETRIEDFTDFLKTLHEEKGEELPNPNKFKLFHPLAGSTLKISAWLELPFDTPDGDYQRFIQKELTKIETKEQETSQNSE
ncbi:hypothetical protein COT77_02025 [Candidatus Berkelbacteria bacterium CG10_big_fil_rev_8_21_14_0_10_41_12]|uniref:Uncharacterized protein n=1 Tax=Candidatus Berkelbacteria bacterium CG10_big_fil_rev_8_21_14_0_10_41_12 TaxID=1974513 RepID=A0A2M6WWY7_9BACT|nr:MAG: hypothetical protein COT77_02025 [Candidatus Berkelbacteria bacterium CG10_big_fil_rev_8_21_14_0_10_41_12]